MSFYLSSLGLKVLFLLICFVSGCVECAQKEDGKQSVCCSSNDQVLKNNADNAPWMSCIRLEWSGSQENYDDQRKYSIVEYNSLPERKAHRLFLENSHLKFSVEGRDSPIFDVELKQLIDGKKHYLCNSWIPTKNIWTIYVDGKEIKSGTAVEDIKHIPALREAISIGVDAGDLLKSNFVVYNNIHKENDISVLSNPKILSNKRIGSNLLFFRVLMIDFAKKDKNGSSSESSEDSSKSSEELKKPSQKKMYQEDKIIEFIRLHLPNEDISVSLFDGYDSSEDCSSADDSAEIKSRHTRSEKSVPSSSDKDEVMLSDQPKQKPVVEETLTKKTASKDEFALSDILDQGNINKFKEFGSKFDPSFNSKIDSFFNRNGGGSPPPTSNSGGSGGLGGLGGLGSLVGGFGGGGNGGMPNLGSLASAFGGGGGGGNGGLNINQFLGSNGFSNFFKKSGDKTPSSPSHPSNPSNTNPYPYNPSYPSANPSNPPAYNPNYPPPPNSGSLYPTLPKDPQPAVPLSNPTNNYNNNNRGSVSLSDIFGGAGGRPSDKAQPNNGPGYDISFGEIFGFGGSKKKEQNPNYPENNHRPSTGGVSLKDILGFGSNKDESKNSYVPSYGTIGGGMEPSKTRPKSSFDEISEGLGLSIDPDPIVRNNKPVVVLNQPNQSSKSSLSESSYKPRESTQLNSQRTNSNTYASRKPAYESSYNADRQKAVEEQIIQASRVKKTRREANFRGSAKYQQRDGDETSFNLQSRTKVGLKSNKHGDEIMHVPNTGRDRSSFIYENDPTNKLFGKESYGFDIIGDKTFPTHSQNEELGENEMSDDEFFGTEYENNMYHREELGPGEHQRENENLERMRRSTRKENVTLSSQREELTKKLLKELRKMVVTKSNNSNETKINKQGLKAPKLSSKGTNRKREATYHNEEAGTADDSKENKGTSIEKSVATLDDNVNSGDESQDIVIAEPDSSLVRLRIVRFIKMFSNFFTYALVPVTSGLFNIMKTLVSNYRTWQIKNSAEGENDLSLFGSGANTITEPSSTFNGFDFSKDLDAINDEAESQQDEITTKKTTKVTTSSSSKSTEVKQNKSSENKEKDKPVTVKPKSSKPKTKKDDSKKFSFDSSIRTKHDDFDFDENLIPRFRRQNKNKNSTEPQNTEQEED